MPNESEELSRLRFISEEVGRMSDELDTMREQLVSMHEDMPLIAAKQITMIHGELEFLHNKLDLLHDDMVLEMLQTRAWVGEDISGQLGRLAGGIGVLATEIRERIGPEEIAQIREMVSEIRAFQEGLLLPWRRQISAELETRQLWLDRIARGECELVHRVAGKYATYETWRHRPTGDTWVRTLAQSSAT